MNYYVYMAIGDSAKEYLKGLDYVGVWENSRFAADEKARRHFTKDTVLIPVAKENVKEKIGYLYW